MSGINEDEGYLLLCFGKKYIKDAADFAETLRHCEDFRPVDIAVGNDDLDFAKINWGYGKIVVFDLENHSLTNRCQNNFEKKCLLPRLNFNKILFRKKTIVVDTDVLCAFKTENLWNFLNKNIQPVVMTGSKCNKKWHWGFWGGICKKINTRPIETHGGFFFFRRESAEDIFLIDSFLKYAEDTFLNYDVLGFLRFYQNGAVDEPCFARAFSLMNWNPIEFSEFPIITFNINLEEEIPTKNQTAEFQNCKLLSEIPFIHMFDKNQSLNFVRLKEKIMNTKF